MRQRVRYRTHALARIYAHVFMMTIRVSVCDEVLPFLPLKMITIVVMTSGDIARNFYYHTHV